MINVHARRQFPLEIAIEEGCVTNSDALCGGLPLPNAGAKFDVVNNHIVFSQPSGYLVTFLTLPPNDVVIGLYGEFGTGRIVLTGPDNSYHGDDSDSDNDFGEAKHNQYDLLFHEIDWLLE